MGLRLFIDKDVPSRAYVFRGDIEEVEFASYISIGSDAFMKCINLRKITFHGPVKLYDGAFQECVALKEVVGSEHITNYPTIVFSQCYSLEHYKFGPEINNIGDSAFMSSGLFEADLSGVKLFSAEAFSWCELLRSVILPSNMREIPLGFFNGCTKLTDVVIPDSVEIIDNYAFARTGFKNIKIPDRVRRIGNRAFYNSQLGTVNLSNAKSLEFIADDAFEDSAIRNIDLRNTIITKNYEENYFLSNKNITVANSYYVEKMIS